MPKVNRNAPCPCGSGKKYKNCCLRQDLISEAQRLSLGGAKAALFDQLVGYAQLPRFSSDLNAAFELYWGGSYDLQGFTAFDPDDMRRTLEWFIHDYPIGEERRHLITLFSETQAGDYPEQVKTLLAAWSRSAMGLFRVMAAGPAGNLKLYDGLRQEEFQAQDEPLARNSRQGDLVVGRLYELEGQRYLSSLSLLLPGDYEPGLTDYLIHAHQLYADAHYQQATWDGFLREYGHLFHAFLLSDRAQSLRALIGPGTRFHDPALLRDKLRAHTLHRQQELAQKEMEAEEADLPMQRTETGLILPGVTPPESPKPGPKEPAAKPPTILIPGRDF